MSEEKLPKGWKLKPLKDLNSRKSKNLVPSKFPDTTFELWSVPQFEYSEPEYLKGREIMSTKQKVDLGDVLISKINPRINRVWVVQNFSDYEKIASSEWIIIKPKDFIDSRYIKYVTTAPFFRSLLQSEVSGVGGSLTRARPKIVENYKIPVAPLPEQQRIVAKLDAIFGHLDVLREKLDRIPALLKNFRQQVLTQAVTGELTREWRRLANEGKKHSDIEVVIKKLINKRELLIKEKKVRKVDLKETDKNDNLGDLPKSWSKLSLIEVANIIDPNPSHRMPEYVSEGVPFISTENINGNQLDFQKGKKVTQRTLEEQIKRFDIGEGDFLFTRIGTIGKSCYLPVKREYALSHAVCVISSYLPDQLHPSFLKIILSSKLILDQSQDGIQSVGVPDLGMGKVRAFQIPLTSVEEQNEIVKRVDALFELADKIESQYETLKTKIDQLPQAILAKAFRGELVGQEVKEYVREAGEVMMAAEAHFDNKEN